jgi:hypothetical protein
MALRERTRPGLGIIESCLPSPAKAPPSGPGWIHKIKHDRFRIMARRDSTGVRLIMRRGNDFAARFPLAAEAVSTLVCALGLWTFSALGVSAQQCSQGVAIIGGRPMSCPAIICLAPGLDDVARGGSGQVFLNPTLFSLPDPVQQFVFAHECAHAQGIMNEQAADCQAICWGKQLGAITPLMLQQLCQAVWLTPGDWTHFPGPARCSMMSACYQSCQRS